MSSREVVVQDVDTALEKARARTLQSLWIQTVRKMLKTAMYAALARWAFGLAKSLVKFGGSPQKLLKLLNGELFSMNPFKWAAVFGVISSYRGVQQTIERAVTSAGGDIKVGFTVASLIAGGMSSLGFQAMNNETRTELSLYLFVRSLHGVLTGYVHPNLPKPLKDFQHWDTLSVCVATMQVFYSLFFQPNSISLKYNKFLRDCTMQDPRVFEALAGVNRGHVVPEMVDYCKAKGFPMPPPVVSGKNPPIPLSEIHKYYHPPGTPCRHATITFLRNHFFGFSMKLYLPLKISTTLIFGWKKCVKDPLGQIKKIIKSSVQSSLFLTGYCGGAWPLICLLPNLGFRIPLLVCCLGGLAAGSSTLFEPKARRADLALYIMMHAIRGFYNTLSIRGYLNPATMRHITMLSIASMAAMFYQLETQPEKLHPNVSSSLQAMIGEFSSEGKKKKKGSSNKNGDAKDEEELLADRAQAARERTIEDL